MSMWLDRINAAIADEHDWRADSKKAITEFKKAGRQNGFNILWPNTMIKMAALFSRVPEPVVKRRYRSLDPLSRDASIMLERDIAYQWDIQDSKSILDRVVLDWALTGRGVARVRYEPKVREKFETAEFDEEAERFFITGNEQIDQKDLIEDDEGRVGSKVQEIISEGVPFEHWPWDKFTHDQQARWEDVRWICFFHDMSKKEAKDSFGEANLRRMSSSRQQRESGREPANETHSNSRKNENTYRVYEVWCKEKREVLFLHYKSDGKSEQILGKIKDPYGLRDFYPIPCPLLMVPQPDSLCPITEYSLYESQAKELNVITNRLMRINRRINPRMGYDGSNRTLADLLKTDDMQAIPLENWAQYAEKGGIDGALFFLPIREFAETAGVLRAHHADLLNTIFQLTGISDIVRGATDARETATAQQIKSQFGTMRLRPAQESFQVFIKDLMGIQAELIAEKFDLTTMAAMASMQPKPEYELLLRSDVRRNFAIDIESDSTLAMDEQVKKQEMVEMSDALSRFMGQVQQAKGLGLDNQAAAKMLKFFLSPWRPSRELEEEFERLAAQPRQEGPSMEDQIAQMRAQTEQSRLQLDAQAMQGEQQVKVGRLQLDQAKAQDNAAIAREKLFLEAVKVSA